MALPHELGGSRRERFEIFKKKLLQERTTKEHFMTKQTSKNFALTLGLLGLALIPSTSVAQVGLASKLPGKNPATAAAQAASQQAKTPGAPSYTYTLLNFPGTFYTFSGGINMGVTTSKTEIVGGYGSIPQPAGGFLAQVSGTKTVKEAFEAVNDPQFGLDQGANAVNDSGQIVGYYVDGSGAVHGYERSGGKFATLDVPFAGATGTYADGINNSGEVVGGWIVSDGFSHGFTRIGGTYASFDYPGASQTFAIGVNTAGDIVGYYDDTSGVEHGFLLSGGTYTSFDPPGSLLSLGFAINDAGIIVGAYCTTSECQQGEQGFVLSGGVFTTITIPSEPFTWVTGINNNGVLLGQYQDAAGLVVSFLATP
jgi:hypothetical protein